jgi:hypothetical protein
LKTFSLSAFGPHFLEKAVHIILQAMREPSKPAEHPRWFQTLSDQEAHHSELLLKVGTDGKQSPKATE